jgi:hypothetical protein
MSRGKCQSTVMKYLDAMRKPGALGPCLHIQLAPHLSSRWGACFPWPHFLPGLLVPGWKMYCV